MSAPAGTPPTRPQHLRSITVGIGVLLVIVAVFIVIRLVTDTPHIADGTVPDDDFAERYVAHPWIAYLHIGLGAVYLFAAPLQLSRRFRTRHYDVHRRLGRVLLTCGLASGIFALIFGALFAWGGTTESVAAVVFGVWFLASLMLAFVAIRRGDVVQHRRWMIRAFAVGIGIGTIRIWVGLFTTIYFASGGDDDAAMPEPIGFGIAFWLAFAIHVALGEWWLRRTPALDG